MWMVYALLASVIWGVSYAASGRVIERGLSPLTFFFCYALFGMLVAGSILATTGKFATIPAEVRGLGGDWKWLVVAILTSAIGGILIYLAIGEKNATLASLIEISYPFLWLFLRGSFFAILNSISRRSAVGS